MKGLKFILLILAFCVSLHAFVFDVDSRYKGWTGRPDTVKVYVDTTFTTAQKDSVQTAIDRWNNAGSTPKLKMTSTSSEAGIRIYSSSTVSGAGSCAAHPSWSDTYDSCTIKINTTRTIGMAELATHEIGHALGLNDTKNASDCMKSHGSNGSDGALSSHDSSEIKSASKIASTASTVKLPVMPIESVVKNIITPVFWPLSRVYTPDMAATAVISVGLMGNSLLGLIDMAIHDDLLEIHLLPEITHWTGMVHLDVHIEFDPIYELPPEEFIAKLYVSETPVPPIVFDCWFEAHQEGSLILVEWMGMNNYPHPEFELRSNLTVNENFTMFCKDGAFYILELDPGTHTFELCVDDYHGNYSTFSAMFDVLAIDDISTLPKEFEISAFPNPFNSAVSITAPENAKVEIFDVLGQSVDRLPGGEQVWRPEPSVGSGIYLVRATKGTKSTTKRIVYLK